MEALTNDNLALESMHIGRPIAARIIFKELVAEMVRDDLKAAGRDELVKKHRYKAMDYEE